MRKKLGSAEVHFLFSKGNHVQSNDPKFVHVLFLKSKSNRRYIIGYSTFLRIELGKWFLGRSCQNEFMQSNNFHLQLHVSNCNEVEAWANNYENKGSL